MKEKKLTINFGFTMKSLVPPTGISFFIRLKQLKRHSCSPLLFTLRLKSTSSQLYLQIEKKKNAMAECTNNPMNLTDAFVS